MSKVVCDICGTAYAETADQCPICGAAKTENTRPVAEAETETTGYAYVKGGRFSQSNVRRHNSGKQELPREVEAPKEEPQQEKAEEVVAAPVVEEEMFANKPERKPRPAPAPKKKAPQGKKPQAKKPQNQKSAQQAPEDEQPSNLALIIIVVVLLLAIIGVGAYVAMSFVNANNAKKANEGTTAPSSSSSSVVNVPCTGLTIPGAPNYTISDLSQTINIEVKSQPANTTDMLNFDYDDQIIRVEKSGNQWIITPVGNGETTLTFSCGDQVASIQIVCNMPIPCTSVTIDGPARYAFTKLEESAVLNVIVNPNGTTDELTWEYGEEGIVVVAQENGQWVMRPVASGQTIVTVKCGEYSYPINVEVDLIAGFELKWTCAPYQGEYDYTLSGYGTKMLIYKAGDIVPLSDITFTSSNEEVATVKDGYVYIWKNGKATITASYGNKTSVPLTIRATNVDAPAPGEPVYIVRTNYGTSGADVTLRLGETVKLYLYLCNENGEPVEKVTEGVTFSVAEGEECISVDENGKVTTLAVIKAGTYVYVEYQGHVYKCLIRVREAA